MSGPGLRIQPPTKFYGGQHTERPLVSKEHSAEEIELKPIIKYPGDVVVQNLINQIWDSHCDNTNEGMMNELSVSRFRKVIREVVEKLGYDQPISNEKLDRIMRFDLN